MRTCTVTSLMFLISAGICGQGIKANVEMSYSSYSMSSLKAFQQDLIKASKLPMQAVQSFPSYYGYAFSLTSTSRRSEYGIFFGYNSTAGRIDLEDYSGSIRSDQLLNCFSYGILYQYQLNHSDRWKIYTSVHMSTVLSNSSITTSVEVGGTTQTGRKDLYATSYGFRPGFLLRRDLGRFSIYAEAGYEIQTQGVLHFKDSNDQLQRDDGTSVYTQWGGFRLSAGLGISFNKHSHTP